MKKLALVTVVLSVLIIRAHAQIVIAPANYHIDENLKLIVCNFDVAEFSIPNKGFQTIQLGELFTFSPADVSLKAGDLYTVSKNGVSYKLYFTRLPLAIVTTSSDITDEPKTSGKIIISDTGGLAFSSSMGIEIRGGSTQIYPKKSYDLELWTNSVGSQTRDASFFGMREDDDWLLLSLYNEALRVNNMFSHDLWLKMHTLYYHALEAGAVAGVHAQYIEVFINGEYMGIYALAEQLDNKQLGLKKYSGGQIRGELYKGAWWSEPVLFTGVLPFTNSENWWGGYEYKFPDEKVDWTNLASLTDFVVNSPDDLFKNDIFTWVEKSNMIDYFIFLNVLRATDNTGKNAYLARYTTDQPYFYIPWDLDGVLGYDYSGNKEFTPTGMLSNGLFDRLFALNPDHYREDLQERWFTLRESLLSKEEMNNLFMTYHTQLLNNGVYEREFLKWNGLVYDEGNLAYTQTWLDERFTYLDEYFTGIAERDLTARLNVYPNPSSGMVQIDSRNIKGTAEVRIFGTRGEALLAASFKLGSLEPMDLSGLSKGIYLVQISTPLRVAVFKLALY